MFVDYGNSYDKNTSLNTFRGFSYEYEINSGERKFYIQEIEVYQILFK